MIKVYIDDNSESYDVYATREECCYVYTSEFVDEETAKRWIKVTQDHLAMNKEIRDMT